MALSKLVVEIAARIREYMADMDKAATATEASAARIERADKTMVDAAKDAATGQATMADTAVQVAARMGPVGGVVAAAAAVVAGYGLASYKAAQENTALVRALALSGNQAGVTAGQLQGMAAAASHVVGTHGQAAEAIGLMVSGGKVAGENLQALTVTALNASRTLGIGVQETVKHYEALADSPTKASAKLNESMGYLNAETYRRIQALEEMGRKDEAAALAQQTYARGADDAIKKVEASLGSLQRGWRKVGKEAGKAWDWMLGLGRKDEVQDSLAGLRQKLDEKERQLRAGFATTGGGAAVGMRGMSDDRRGQLEAEAEGLREQIRLMGRAGATAAANAAASARYQKEGIEWADKAAAAEERLKSNATKRAEAIAKADEALRDGHISTVKHAALVADAERQFADKVTKGNDGERERLRLLKAQQHDLDELVKQLLAREKAEHDAGVAATKAYDQAIDRQDKATASAENELERQLDLNAAMGLGKEAVAELAAAKIEEAAASKERQAALADDIDWSGRMGDAYRDEAAALYALAKAKREGAAKSVRLDNDKAWKKEVDDTAKDAAAEWKRTSQQIEQSLTDALMRGFESGKDFAKVLRDTVVNMFKTMVLRPIISAVVNPVAGAITGSLGLPGAANASTGSDLLGTASNLGSAYDTLSNGVSNAVTAGFDKLATSGFGQKIGLSDSIDFGTGYEQVATNSTGATLGQYAGMAGNALAGYGLQKAISGGYKTGESGLVDAITVAASAYFGPIAGVAAGVFNRAFGRKLADQGIQGQFGGEAGFTGENYTFEKGGWFRSDKTKTSALDAGMQSGLADQFNAIRVQTALMATVLGDTGQSVADFTSSIKLSFNGLTEAQIGEKLAETFAGIANDLAKTVLGDSAFSKEGEAASQTLQRLANSLTTVNGTFDVLGFSLEAVSLAGANAASGFVDLMGGLDAFKATTASYYANFYSEAERQAKATEQLTAQLAGLGQAMPATRDGFRALVTAAEAAGNDALLAGLLNLQDEFAALVPAAEVAAAAVSSIADGIRTSVNTAITTAYNGARQSAMSALRASVAQERAMLDNAASAASTLVGKVQSVFDTLSDAVQSLRADANAVGTAEQGAAFISAALAQAQATGALPEQQALADAIQAARSGLVADNFSSVAEQQFAQLKLAGELEALQSVSGSQLTNAQYQLQVAEDQLKALDDTLAYWEQQVNAAEGNVTATLSVGDAVRSLQVALSQSLDEGFSSISGVGQKTLTDQLQSVANQYSPGTTSGSVSQLAASITAGTIGLNDAVTYLAGTPTTSASYTQNVTDGGATPPAFYAMLRTNIDTLIARGLTGEQLSQTLIEYGVSLTDASKAYGITAAEVAANLLKAGASRLPQLAVGTNYVPQDMLAVIHQGEAVVPKAFNPWANGAPAAMGGNTQQLERLVEGLTAEVQRLQALVGEGNRYARDTAQTLDQVTEGGGAMRTTTA